MNEFQQRLALRGTLVVMALLAALSLVPFAIREILARLARGAAIGDVMPPFPALVFGALALMFAALTALRIWRLVDLTRRGTCAAAVVTASDECDDLTRRVHYQFRDRQGLPQAGYFRWPDDAWAPGDAGQVAYHAENPGQSAWITGAAPRIARPVPKPPSFRRRFALIYWLLVLAFSAACGAGALYGVWGQIFRREGFAGALQLIEPMKVLLSWAFFSAISVPVAAILVALLGGVAVVGFTVMRAMLRD